MKKNILLTLSFITWLSVASFAIQPNNNAGLNPLGQNMGDHLSTPDNDVNMRHEDGEGTTSSMGDVSMDEISEQNGATDLVMKNEEEKDKMEE